MKPRFLAAILASILITPQAALASNIPALDLLTAQAAPQPVLKQCVPALCPIQVADDETIVIPDVCSASTQTQCTNDCQMTRAECESGHDDSVPCEGNYTTCASNCSVIAGCSN